MPSKVDFTKVFVAPPAPTGKGQKSQSIARVLKNYDPAIRDAANRKLGKAGEEYVLNVERDRLIAIGRDDLSGKVAWVAQEIEDGLGYDIESFANDGNPIFIEVKTTKGPIETPFFVTENERSVAGEKGSAFHLYRLFDFENDPRIYSFIGPLDDKLSLEPISYRARLK